ncbi:hypothetical protein SpCBS45565_g06184 [Spizellomyces sp. 'palustris']|nr:hypothetical protein SpCBS45565_g06184 [Spizellomyces sp. 'palustris']
MTLNGATQFSVRNDAQPCFHLRSLPYHLKAWLASDPTVEKGSRQPDIARYQEDLQTLREFKSNLLDPHRIQCLQQIYDRVIAQFRNYRPILTDIKHEYDLCIAALFNIVEEKVYIRSKCQKLMCENGSEEEFDHLRSLLVHLTFRKQMIEKENAELKKTCEEEETKFLTTLGRSFVQNVSSDVFSDKQIHILRSKDRWASVDKWMREKAADEDIFKELLTKFEANPDFYQTLLESEDLADIYQPKESPEMRKINAEIEEQHKIMQERKKELADLKTRQRGAQGELKSVFEQIEHIEVLIEVAQSRLAAVDRENRSDE